MKLFLRTMILAGALTVGANAAMADEGDKYFYILGSVLDPDSAYDQEDGYGAQLGFGHGMNDWMNVEGYLRSSRADGSPKFSSMVIGADVQLLLSQNHRFQPYLFGGLGYLDSDLSGSDSETGAVLDGGLGLRTRIFGDSGTSLRLEYRYSAYKSHDLRLDDQYYGIGLQFPFGSKAAPVVVPVAVGDGDGDGVKDDVDRCPNTPAGVSVDASGCTLDSDGDGVADNMDECPGTVRGAKVDAKGCELDGDADGVVDRLDECPDSAPGAQVDMKGCEIQDVVVLTGVNFETNSDVLAQGAASILNNVATTMLKYPTIKVEVGGHTDSDGSAEYNESLSARRAATVRDYLIRRGVDPSRATARGYGESEPIADNATAAGKAANRRVVLRITER